MAHLCVYLTVAFHVFIVIANIIGVILVGWRGPWYLAIPIWTLLANLICSSQVTCPLTILENHFRRKAGMPEIGIFLEHYFGWKVGKR